MTREEAHAKVNEWIDETGGKMVTSRGGQHHYGKAELHRDITRIFDSFDGKPKHSWYYDENHSGYLPVTKEAQCVKVTDKNDTRIMTTKCYQELCEAGHLQNPITVSRITK